LQRPGIDASSGKVGCIITHVPLALIVVEKSAYRKSEAINYGGIYQLENLLTGLGQ
jgi:hypothetical protein